MVLGDSTQEPHLKGKTEIISKLRNLRNVHHIVSRKGLRAGRKESGSANPEKKVRGAEKGEADQKEPGIRAVGHNTVVGRDGVLSLGCPQESAGAGAQSPGESQKLWISQLRPDSVGGNWEQLEPRPGCRSESLGDTWLET